MVVALCTDCNRVLSAVLVAAMSWSLFALLVADLMMRLLEAQRNGPLLNFIISLLCTSRSTLHHAAAQPSSSCPECPNPAILRPRSHPSSPTPTPLALNSSDRSTPLPECSSRKFVGETTAFCRDTRPRLGKARSCRVVRTHA